MTKTSKICTCYRWKNLPGRGPKPGDCPQHYPAVPDRVDVFLQVLQAAANDSAQDLRDDPTRQDHMTFSVTLTYPRFDRLLEAYLAVGSEAFRVDNK